MSDDGATIGPAPAVKAAGPSHGSPAGSTDATGPAANACTVASLVELLKLFIGPTDVTELRALDVEQQYGRPAIMAGFYDGCHLEEMARQALAITKAARGVYFTFNPLVSEILARSANRLRVAKSGDLASDHHVLLRRWLLVDVDPVRLAGIGATDAEKAAARDVAEAIRGYLEGRGWPPPIVADSGNGWHLFYRIDLPADDGGLTERCLAALAQRHDDDAAKVDTAVHNPSRLTRCPCTYNRKGDSTPDRRHRRSSIVEIPADLRVVPADLLHALAAEAAPASANTPQRNDGQQNGRAGRHHRLDVARWLTARGVEFRQKDTPDAKGRTVYALAACPFNPSHTVQDAAILQDADGKVGFHCFHDSCAGRDWQDAKRKIGPPDPGHYDPPLAGRVGATIRERAGGDDRPEIVITTEEHEVNDQAVAALTRDPAIYQRGGQLVRIVRDTSPAAKGIRRPLSPRIDAVPQPLVRERLAENARWIKITRQGDGVVLEPGRPPAWCVSAVHARGEWRDIRHLEALVDYPVLRHDGTLLSLPGYDARTGLFLEPTGPLPMTPDTPSRAHAMTARDTLLDVVRDFPFADPIHRAAWLAGLLTPLARFAFTGPAPLFLCDSNIRGAGKGLLLNSIAKIVTGQEFTVATFTTDENELRKRITSLVLEGDRLVLFDNLDGRFGGAVLDAALTATSWKDRLLGVNRTASAPIYLTWYATGNNVLIGADTSRRVCHIRLESPEEHPEERADFQRPHLLPWIGENRLHLLTAALTILRGYIVAGRPDMKLTAWGSYEGWSALVRSAVVWVGMPDPGQTRVVLQETADTPAQHMAVLLDCWERMDSQRQGLTASQVVEALRHPASPPAEWHSDMRDAIEGLANKLDSRLLGYKLRAFRRRVFAGRYLDHAGKDHHAIRWVVYPASAFGRGTKHAPHPPHAPTRGEDGEHGEDVSRNGQPVHGVACEADDSEML